MAGQCVAAPFHCPPAKLCFAHRHASLSCAPRPLLGTPSTYAICLQVMVPKLIHPLPPSTPRTPGSQGCGDEIEEDPPTPHPGVPDTWMAAINEERPPTPPRGRPQTHSLETF